MERPKIYILPILFNQLEEAIAASLETGEEVDPAIVNSILSEGPKLMDDYSFFIESYFDDAELCRKKAKDLTERARRLEASGDKAKEYLKEILNANFEGKCKTALGTYSVRKSQTMEFDATPQTHPEFFKVEYTIKKKDMIDLFKKGELPDDINIRITDTESVVVRR